MEYSFIDDEINNILNGVINFIDIDFIRNNWYIYIDYFSLDVIMSRIVSIIMVIFITFTVFIIYYTVICIIYYTFIFLDYCVRTAKSTISSI